MNVRVLAVVCSSIVFVVSGCASMTPDTKQRHTTRVVSYLYPDAKDKQEAPVSSKATLHIPISVGIAFVPETMESKSSLPETERIRLLNTIKSAFSQYPFISSISVIPSSYLNNRGGFSDLERAKQLFNIDLVTLLSYDQVQFSDATGSSIWYWTLVGAYLAEGDKYDISTIVEASTFDINSRKLLFRSSGMSTIKGTAEAVGFSDKARESRKEGFNQAIEQLIPNAKKELDMFQERAKDDSSIEFIFAPDYKPEKQQ